MSDNPSEVIQSTPKRDENAIPVWTARLNRDGQVLSADMPGNFPLFQNASPEPGSRLSEFFPAKLAAQITESIRTTTETGAVQSFEHSSQTETGIQYHEGRIVAGEGDDFLLILQDITHRKQAEEALLRSREQLRDLAGHVESIREEERKRIARDVHDALGQALTALRIDLASIQKSLSDEQEDLHDRLGLMNASIGSIIQTVRRIAADLRPGVLDDLGIVAALEWQTDEFAKRTGIACSFTPSVNYLEMNPDCSTALFRVYQEVLTNVARHAEASAVQVSLRHRDGKIVLRVKDNGRGIREQEVKDMRSLGLVGMRERLLPWEGRVEFRGKPDHGTTVTIILPDDHLSPTA